MKIDEVQGADAAALQAKVVQHRVHVKNFASKGRSLDDEPSIFTRDEPQIDRVALCNLTDMGFDKAKVIKVLQLTNGNYDLALDMYTPFSPPTFSSLISDLSSVYRSLVIQSNPE